MTLVAEDPRPITWAAKPSVYVRQSTPKQVLLNQESNPRQYQLAEVANEWGCATPLIRSLTMILGLSGASSHTESASSGWWLPSGMER